MNPIPSAVLPEVDKRRSFGDMRLALLSVLLLWTAPALAGRSTALRLGVQVVSSARIVASASGGRVGLETRTRGASASAVLVEQRSGASLRLRSGAALPRAGERPLVLPGGASELAFAPAAGGAEVVVTLFTDGVPPDARN